MRKREKRKKEGVGDMGREKKEREESRESWAREKEESKREMRKGEEKGKWREMEKETKGVGEWNRESYYWNSNLLRSVKVSQPIVISSA